MKIFLSNVLLSLFLLTFTQLVFANQKEFCNSYDPQITHMNAAEESPPTHYVAPKKLSTQEAKTLSNIINTYDPTCSLKNDALCQQRLSQKSNIMPSSVYKNTQVAGDRWMKMAAAEALKSVQHGGGPFGAVILQVDDSSGKVIRYWTNHNHVVEWTDPTAHAEVSTIRAAAKELGVIDLGHISKNKSKLSQPGEWSHCVLYSSAEPCPMCLAALYWAGIKSVVFGATRFDAEAKGVDFSDKMIYEELALPYHKRKHMHVVHANINHSLDAFNYYKRNDVARYGERPEIDADNMKKLASTTPSPMISIAA